MLWDSGSFVVLCRMFCFIRSLFVAFILSFLLTVVLLSFCTLGTCSDIGFGVSPVIGGGDWKVSGVNPGLLSSTLGSVAFVDGSDISVRLLRMLFNSSSIIYLLHSMCIPCSFQCMGQIIDCFDYCFNWRECWLRNIFVLEKNCVRYSFALCFLYVNDVASVMVEWRSEIPSINWSFSPCSSIISAFMHLYCGFHWSEWSSVVIKCPSDILVSRYWLNCVGLSEKVERENCLR